MIGLQGVMATKTSTKLKTKASSEPMRWAGDSEAVVVERRPSSRGNDFDVRMSEEPDGVKAAHKVVEALKARGACLVEANAPPELLYAACEEAQELWEDGTFVPPLRVHDSASMLQARLWQSALGDEKKVAWIRDEEPRPSKTGALRALAGNMKDFAAGLGPLLEEEMGLRFDVVGQAMLSCYTGDRTYGLHIDNPHSGAGEATEGGDEPAQSEDGLLDNGLRLTLAYYLNTHWDPSTESESGGLDLCLADPMKASPSEARRAPRLRAAPHADTLAIFLSQRTPHQVVATKGDSKWFCMTIWTMFKPAMEQATRTAAERAVKAEKGDDDGDSS